MEAGTDMRPPRGALAVIAVGLIATLAAAYLSTDKPIGATELSWVTKAPLAASTPAAIPGGGQASLTAAGIRATEPNVSGYRLYRVAAILRIAPGSAVGRARVKCAMRTSGDALVTQTPNSRASYPRPSEELTKQGVPQRVVVEFNSNGTEAATLELGDAFDSFATERGIVVEWPTYREAVERWQWGLPAGRPARPLELGFASIWRATSTPAARISCTVQTAAGPATVTAAGALRGLGG